MPKGITKIIYVNDLGLTPARCQRSTGICWVSLKYWRTLPKEHKLFILLHENAHISLNTTNEYLADKKAHEDYMKLGYSLNESVKALTRILTFNGNEEHLWRAYFQLNRAKKYDFEHYKNSKLSKWYNENKNKF